MDTIMKTDEQLKIDLQELKSQKKEVDAAFLLLGFKGRLSRFFALLWNFINDLLDSKVNRSEHKVFSGADYTGEGTDDDPYRIKFPETEDTSIIEIIETFTLEHEGLKNRIQELEEYIKLTQEEL